MECKEGTQFLEAGGSLEKKRSTCVAYAVNNFVCSFGQQFTLYYSSINYSILWIGTQWTRRHREYYTGYGSQERREELEG